MRNYELIIRDGIICDYADAPSNRLFIPKNVTGFLDDKNAQRAFLYSKYDEIVVEEGNDCYEVKDGCLIDLRTRKIILTTTDASIPSNGTIKSIGPCAFNKDEETKVLNDRELTIPKGVETIGYRAFANRLDHPLVIEVPESVKKIESMAFMINTNKLDIVINGDPELETGVFGTKEELLDTRIKLLQELPDLLYVSKSDLTVYGSKNSNTEKYCNKYDIKFVALNTIRRSELHCHSYLSVREGSLQVKELLDKAKEHKLSAIAITDTCNVYAYPEIRKELSKMTFPLKAILGMEGYLENKDGGKPYHFSILVQNETGKNNLFRLLGEVAEDYADEKPVIIKRLIRKYRNGLLLGSGDYKGEVHTLLAKGLSIEEVCKRAAFYDYLEVQSPDGDIEKEREIIRKIVKIGEALNKPVVATSDTHYIDHISKECTKLANLWRNDKIETNQSMDIKDTEAILKEFSFLGEEKAKEIVITNSNNIAEKSADICELSDKYYEFYDPKDDVRLKKICKKALRKLYKTDVSYIVESRLDDELSMVKQLHLATVLLLVSDIIRKCKKDGYDAVVRGAVGNSFIAYLLGITWNNPLESHCTNILNDKSYKPSDITLYYQLSSIKNSIDISFAPSYAEKVENYLVKRFGPKNAIFGRNIARVYDDPTEIQKKYFSEYEGADKSLMEDPDFITRVSDMTPCTKPHFIGMHLVPRGVDVETITPIAKYKDDGKNNKYVAHISRSDLEENLYKINICHSIDLEILHIIEKYSKKKITLDEFTIKEAVSFIANNSAFSFDSSPSTKKIIAKLAPTTLEELVKATNLCHNTYHYYGDTDKTYRDLVLDGTIKLNEAITCREELFDKLFNSGVDANEAYEISEMVRKGKTDSSKWPKWDWYKSILKSAGISDEEIKSLESIAYLFPMAHTLEWIRIKLLLALYQKRYPREYFSVYYAFESDDAGNVSEEFEEECKKSGIDDADFYKERAKLKDKIYLGKYN